MTFDIDPADVVKAYKDSTGETITVEFVKGYDAANHDGLVEAIVETIASQIA